MSEHQEWQELIDRHLHGELNESEKEQLAELLDSDPSVRKGLVEQVEWDVRFAEALKEEAERPAAIPVRPRMTLLGKVLLAAAAIIILSLSGGLFFMQSNGEKEIVTIQGLNGALRWTGSGGRVSHNLQFGEKLPGGTVDGLAPDSWLKLEFQDGTSVTITGRTTLTISDDGQKKLVLKEGNMSGTATPQPAGHPMVVRTPSAMLEVVGTQFAVEADNVATALSVSEGKVRVKRLSDGSTVDVPASHRVLAAADREFRTTQTPGPVNSWKSPNPLGPHGRGSKWIAGTLSEPSRLEALPYITDGGKVIYSTGMGVSIGDRTPVMLQPGSRYRMLGRIGRSSKVYFGMTVRHPNGEFAGRFQTIRPASDFKTGEYFEVDLDVHDFVLDPSLHKMREKLPGSPFHLIVSAVWCHTLYEQVGLGITGAELAPPPPKAPE